MGIVKQELANFCLSSGEKVKIELNTGDSIHIHVDNIRISLSVEKFQELDQMVSNAKEELEKSKDDIN